MSNENDKYRVVFTPVEEHDYESIISEARKEAAIQFFKWNAEKVASFVVYMQDVIKIVRSKEVEENLAKFEGATIEERYDMFEKSKLYTDSEIY